MKLDDSIPFVSPASLAVSSLTVILVYLVTSSARDRVVQHLPTTAEDYPILQNSLEIINAQKSGKFLHWVLNYCIKYQGKPWCLRFIGEKPCVVLCCPKEFEDVQKTRFHAFDKSPNVSEAMFDVLGHGIFAVSGPLWQHQCKTASHLFTTDMMQYAMEIVVPAKGKKLVTRLDDICQNEDEVERVVEMNRLLNLYTMDVFGKVGFNVDLRGMRSDQNKELLNAFDRVSVLILERIQYPCVDLEATTLAECRKGKTIGRGHESIERYCVQSNLLGIFQKVTQIQKLRQKVTQMANILHVVLNILRVSYGYCAFMTNAVPIGL